MWNRLSRGRTILIGAAIFAVAIFLVIASASLAFITPSMFEGSDGNLEGAADWKSFNDAGLVAVGPDNQAGDLDDSFGGGAKEDTENPTIALGSIPKNKSDLQRIYVANEKIGATILLGLYKRTRTPAAWEVRLLWFIKIRGGDADRLEEVKE